MGRRRRTGISRLPKIRHHGYLFLNYSNSSRSRLQFPILLAVRNFKFQPFLAKLNRWFGITWRKGIFWPQPPRLNFSLSQSLSTQKRELFQLRKSPKVDHQKAEIEKRSFYHQHVVVLPHRDKVIFLKDTVRSNGKMLKILTENLTSMTLFYDFTKWTLFLFVLCYLTTTQFFS